jgi:hypothetical protein
MLWAWSVRGLVMSDQGLYGRRLAAIFHLNHAVAFVTRTLYKSEIAVTEIKCDAERLTKPIPAEDALLVALQLRACRRYQLWIDDQPCKTEPLEAGVTCFYDLRRNPIAKITNPFHSLYFYLPRRALNLIADKGGLPHVDDYIINHGRAVNDQTICALGYSLLPAFQGPDETSQTFVDHVTIAVAAHVLETYTVPQVPTAS